MRSNGRAQPHLALVIASLGLAIGICFATTGFPIPTDPTFDRGSDALTDWLVVNAAWDGVDPYQEAQVLADLYFGQVSSEGSPTELPATFVLQSVLALVDPGWGLVLDVGAALAGTAAVLWLAMAAWGINWRVALIALPLVMVTVPMLQAFAFGNVAPVYVALVVGAWAAARSDSGAWLAGIPLGVAIAGRGWPLVVAAAFVAVGWWRPAAIAGATAVVLSVGGLLVPGVLPQAVLDGMRASSSFWIGNGANSSVPGFLAREFGWTDALPMVAVVSGMFIAMIWAIRRRSDHAVALAAVGGVLASPLAWPFYFLVCVPWLPLLWRQPQVRLLAGAGMAVMAVSFNGSVVLLGGLLFAAAIVRSALYDRRVDTVVG